MSPDIQPGKWYWARYEAPGSKSAPWMIVEPYGDAPFLRIKDALNERRGDRTLDDLALTYCSNYANGRTLSQEVEWQLVVYGEVEKPHDES